MNKALLITRATLFLQTRGLLQGMTAPAPLNKVIAAFEEICGPLGCVSRIKKWATLETLCNEYGVQTGKRRPLEYQIEDDKRRCRTREQNEVGSVTGNDFLLSYEWRRLRMTILKRDGAKCACCGATPKDGVRMNVDHIKPRIKFPELALDPSNLQVLCDACNHGKGAWDDTDWRPR